MALPAPRKLLLAALFALASLVCLQAVASAARPSALAPRKGVSRAAASAASAQLFAPDSFWNAPPTRAARLDPASPRLICSLRLEVEREVAAETGPWIGTSRYSVPIYTVGPDQPTVRVRLTSPVHSPALQAAFEAVPLPPGAFPSGGTDAHLVVWQPASDRLWEFWRFRRGPGGPSAEWGGAMENVSASSGAYGESSWPDAEPWWGASASSLSIAGGLITLEDLRRGEIDHALAIALPQIRAGVYASPARRTDGRSGDPLALPEGARLRLDPRLDLDRLKLPRLTRMIAAAAQRYGLIVRDGAGGVQLFAQDPVTAPINPYTGPGGYFEGRYPTELLASFPWGRLQVLAMELHADQTGRGLTRSSRR